MAAPPSLKRLRNIAILVKGFQEGWGGGHVGVGGHDGTLVASTEPGGFRRSDGCSDGMLEGEISLLLPITKYSV